MTDVSLVDGARTPHGELLGSLAAVEAPALGAAALDGLLDRVAVAPAAVDYVVLGNAIQAGVGQVPARQAVVQSGLPNSTAVTTVNEASGSGVRAIALAADRIAAGRADLVIAGGMESMSNAPHLLGDYRAGRRHGDGRLVDAMVRDGLWDVNADAHMGEITERLVEREGVTREQQDEYALRSHRRAADHIADGTFDPELVAEARKNATKAGVTDQVEFRKQDFFEADISDATILLLYLLPDKLEDLQPKLIDDLEAGTPIVTHDFRFHGWEPEKTVRIPVSSGFWGGQKTIYLWRVPEE